MPYKMDNLRKNGLCLHLPYSTVLCDNFYRCDHCVVADRIRRNTGEVICERPLFGWRDALPQTPGKKGETWFRKPVILSPEAMERLGLEPILKNQIIIAEDGPGVFKHNPCGEIDAILYADPRRVITVNRSECYGMPNPRACEIYDSYFARHNIKKLVDFFEIPTKRRDGF